MTDFDYLRFPHARVGDIFRPYAQVVLRTDAAALNQDMLVDSGADISIIPLTVGELLGFAVDDPKEIVRIGGIGGKIPTVYRQVQAQIDDDVVSMNVAWTQTDDVIPVLGREDLFDRFHIEFRQDEKITRFTRVS